MSTQTPKSNLVKSTAVRPDLDWSQVHETVRMLTLSIVLIEHSMSEGDESVDTLADAFAGIVSETEGMTRVVQKLPDSDEKTALLAVNKSVTNQIRSAITAFQFYDKLCQRLSHVSGSLDSLSDIISDPSRLYNPAEWHILQQAINSKHTIEKDRLLFEAILGGASIKEAVAMSDNTAKDDDIELF